MKRGISWQLKRGGKIENLFPSGQDTERWLSLMSLTHSVSDVGGASPRSLCINATYFLCFIRFHCDLWVPFTVVRVEWKYFWI